MTSGIGLITRGWICPKRNVTKIYRYILPLSLSLEEQKQLNLILNTFDYFALNLLLMQYLNIDINKNEYTLTIQDPTKLNLQVTKCEA